MMPAWMRGETFSKSDNGWTHGSDRERIIVLDVSSGNWPVHSKAVSSGRGRKHWKADKC